MKKGLSRVNPCCVADDSIDSACSDLHESDVQAVREVLPKTRLVVDRFHIAKLYRQAVDDLRKTELKRLRKALPQPDYQLLKGSLWAFRKNQADLQPEKRAVLQRFFTYSSALKQAYTLREQLPTIFEQAPFKNAAKRLLRDWQAHVDLAALPVSTSSCARFSAIGTRLPIIWSTFSPTALSKASITNSKSSCVAVTV